MWTDFDDEDIDLYIAKCRQFVNDPQDPRRVNQLWVNDGQGNYTEEASGQGFVFSSSGRPTLRTLTTATISIAW